VPSSRAGDGDAGSELLALARADAILLWDPSDRTLIVANIVGTWLAPTGVTRVTVTSPDP
jgi:hypothetical protein